MKIVIDIPEEVKIAFNNAESNDLKGGYYDHGGVIGNAIKNSTPLEKVIEDIKAEIDELDRYYDNDYCSGNNDAMYKCNEVLQIIDKHISGKER